ncbi:MAG TPA: hypothetical protein VNO23_19065, partial [Candidatus Binatia bacterium]|nr:hypothetical protein [Candidatus Binatia bacterium]
MRRLASRILVVVALFVVAVVGLLVTRSRTVPGEAAFTGPAPSSADLSIKDVELREETTDGARWHLRAEHAQVFEAEGRTALRGLTVQVHHQGRTWTIVG